MDWVSPMTQTTRTLNAIALCTLAALCAAGVASAQLPVPVPAVDQTVATPAGTVSARAGPDGADVGGQLAAGTGLVPLPVGAQLSQGVDVKASTDGVTATATTAADAAGVAVGAHTGAQAGLDGASLDGATDGAVATGVHASAHTGLAGEVGALLGAAGDFLLHLL
ncbi:MAG: hypothetical protein ACYDBQ_05750 [Thermoplasmatota archaeon]